VGSDDAARCEPEQEIIRQPRLPGLASGQRAEQAAFVPAQMQRAPLRQVQPGPPFRMHLHLEGLELADDIVQLAEEAGRRAPMPGVAGAGFMADAAEDPDGEALREAQLVECDGFRRRAAIVTHGDS
jgi:hypothetical protein